MDVEPIYPSTFWNIERQNKIRGCQMHSSRMSNNYLVRNIFEDDCILPPFQRVEYNEREYFYTYTASSLPCRRDLNSVSSISSSVVASGISGTTTLSVGDSLPGWSLPGIGSPNSATTASWRLWTAARKLPREIEGTLRELSELGCACVLWRSRWNRHMRMTDKLCSLTLMTLMKPD